MKLLMTGIEPGSSVIGSDHCANCDTTNAQLLNFKLHKMWHNSDAELNDFANLSRCKLMKCH